MKILLLLGFLLTFGCGQGIPDSFIKPTINKKIALTLKKYQSTKCLTHCLVERIDDCYCDIDGPDDCKEVEKKCVKTCPLK